MRVFYKKTVFLPFQFFFLTTIMLTLKFCSIEPKFSPTSFITKLCFCNTKFFLICTSLTTVFMPTNWHFSSIFILSFGYKKLFFCTFFVVILVCRLYAIFGIILLACSEACSLLTHNIIRY